MSETTPGANAPQFAAVPRKRSGKKFLSMFSAAGRAHPRPASGGGGGGVLRALAMLAAGVVVFGNSASTEITAQLVSSAILWGAVGYVLTWVVQYAFDASWEGDWGLFIARVTMPLIALLLFSTIGLSIATGAASRIATVTETAPPVQSAASLGSGLVRILGGVTQSAALTAASWGAGADWGGYASGVNVPTVGATIDQLGSQLVAPSLPAGLSVPQVALPAVAVGESKSANESEFAATSAGQALRANNVAVSGNTYTVRSGDTLSSIAKAIYGDANAWTAICAANNLGVDCNLLHTGKTLVIPELNQNTVNLVRSSAPVRRAQPAAANAPARAPVVGVHAAQMDTNNLVTQAEVQSLAQHNAQLGVQARATAAVTGDAAALNGNSEMLMFGMGK